MTKSIKILTWGLATLLCIFINSCDVDEPSNNSDENASHKSDLSLPESDLSLPEFRSDLSHGDFDGVYFRCRFGNGGDSNDNMSCVVHWIRYTEEPASTPQKHDMDYHEEMRNFKSDRFSIVFEKAHAGKSVRGWLYYYFECTNSKGSTESEIYTRYVRQNY